MRLVVFVLREAQFKFCHEQNWRVIQVWWRTCEIQAVKRLKQEDHDFEASLGYEKEASSPKRKKKIMCVLHIYESWFPIPQNIIIVQRKILEVINVKTRLYGWCPVRYSWWLSGKLGQQNSKDQLKIEWAEDSTVSHEEASLQKSVLSDPDLNLQDSRTARSVSQQPAMLC